MENKENLKSFTKRVWTAGAIIAFIVLVLLFIRAVFNVLLLVLAGALIAIYFRGFGSLIERKTGWKSGICLTISIVATVLIISGLFFLIGSKAQTQFESLTETLPKTVDNAKDWLNQSPAGRKIVEHLSSPQSVKSARGIAERFFRSTFGVFGDIYIMLFVGVYLTASPRIYTRGIIKLVPKNGREKAEEVVQNIGETLKRWLKGQIFAMFVVFAFTAIGLIIIGMPMWLALAMIAGLLNFIPNLGPIIAMIPAVLVALLQGPQTAAIVAGLYLLVQVAESNFITPQIQKRMINVPPALLIVSQLAMGALTGGWGLVLAAPLLVIVMVLVEELYVGKNDGE